MTATPDTSVKGIDQDSADRPARRSALAWSAVAAGLALWWLVEPSACVFGPGDAHADLSLLAHVAPSAAAAILVTAAALGVIVLVAGARGRVLLAVAGTYAIGFGLLVPDLQLLMLVTYLVAVLTPVALLGLAGGAAARGSRRAVVVLGALVVAGVLTWCLGMGGAALAAAGAGVVGAGAALGTRPVVLAFFLAGGLIWGWTAVSTWRVRAARCGWCGRVGAAWTHPESAARWGRWVTVAAALGPAPYALVRLTWLLPAGLRVAPADVNADPGLRLFGLLIGAAALVGGVLTLGLIAHWGEVWPRWVPIVRGRLVPPRLPVILAAVVAAVITVGGCSLVRQAVATHDWCELVGLPLPLWGPLLAAAALACHYRRRPACRRCGRIG